MILKYLKKRQYNTNNDTILKKQILAVYSFARKHAITIILKGYNNIICDGHQGNIATIKRSSPAN